MYLGSKDSPPTVRDKGVDVGAITDVLLVETLLLSLLEVQVTEVVADSSPQVCPGGQMTRVVELQSQVSVTDLNTLSHYIHRDQGNTW